MPVDWRVTSPLLATLFLNFVFANSQGLDPGLFRPLPLYALVLAANAVVVTSVFFIGPALATRAAGRPLLSVISDSLGSVPAFGLRLCVLLYVMVWLATLMGLPLRLWSNNLERQVSSTQICLVGAATLAFLFATGQQSLHTVAKLARFTNGLSIAILVAALIRVHQGWPVLLDGGDEFTRSSEVPDLWAGLSKLASAVAPLALIAAHFGHRFESPRQVAITGLMGVALPLFATLFLAGVIAAATQASPLYRGSLPPTIAMALWSNTARSAMPGRVLVAAITTFGAARLIGRFLAEAVSFRSSGARPGWMAQGILACVVGWAALHIFTDVFAALLDWSARCLGVVAGVITADHLAGKHRAERPPGVDWVGLAASVAGLSASWYVPLCIGVNAHPWWYGWVLPSYLLGFLASLIGRFVQRTSAPCRIS